MDRTVFLQRSFDEFNSATLKLQEAFASLELKFEGINRELEVKNRELERAVAERENVTNYLRSILESLTTGVIVTDLDGKITLLNPCAETLLGATLGEAAGTKVRAYLPAAPRGARTELGGRTVDVLSSPVRSGPGEVIGFVHILRDVTLAEKFEEMSKRSEKLAALGDLAANVAHEIRNPLGSIELFASLLMKNARERKNRERAGQIIASVKNVDNKISNLLMFTKKRAPLMRPLDLNETLREVLAFSGEIISQGGIDLAVRCADGPCPVRGDAEMLKQVFLNIILNALQAMPGGGRLSIATGFVQGYAGAPSGEPAAEISFSDTGPGIPREHVKKIFDPLFTTRDGGSGLGLAIVHNILDAHGGAIDVDTRPGQGTTFRILLPLSQAAASPSGAEPAAGAKKRKRKG